MWSPDKRKISDKETLGRRVFEPSPFFERNGRRVVKISVFIESRAGEDGLSLDRLGIRQPEIDRVVGILTPIARAEAEKRKPPKEFPGWVGIHAGKIANLGVRPDPIEEEPKNPFHALLPLDKFRDAIHADTLAYKLAALAEEKGLIPAADALNEPRQKFRETLSAWCTRLISSVGWH